MESIKCEVCFHPFSIIKHRPRCLPCGHSFCSLCLKQIVNDNIITCPTCRQFYKIDHLQQIPINYSVEKLLGIDYGVKLFSEIKTCNCKEYGETLMNWNLDKKEGSLNINFSDDDTNDCQCNISNPSSKNSTTEEVWWLGKNKGRSLSLVNQQVDQKYSTDSNSTDTKYMNHKIYCRNHKEEIEFYCLNHKEWICKKCTEDYHLKVECTIITKEEEIRGRKLEEQSDSSCTHSANIWWLGKELPNDAKTEKDQINQKTTSTNNLDMVTYCKIHKEQNIYFCLNHQEWICQLCTLVMHPKHECIVINKDEELRGRKLRFYELNYETNCIKHNKEIVLFCLNHKKWICKKCTYEDHPKNECTVISKEEEVRGKKFETEEKIKISIIKYDQLIGNLHNWFISEEKRRNKYGKVSNDAKHKDNIFKNILDQAEVNKLRLELTLSNLCMNGTCEEVETEYNNVTELLTIMMNWEQQQQHWLAQNKQCDDTNCCQEVESLINEYERNKEKLTKSLQSSHMKLLLSEEHQLSLRQQLLQLQIHTESLRAKMRNTFVWCSIICMSVIIISLWFIGNINSEMVKNESQNIEVISQNQILQKRFSGNFIMNNSNKNNSITILKLERRLIDSLDQKYKLHVKYDEAISQFSHFQRKMKEVLNERNEIIRKLEKSHSTKNETKLGENFSYDYFFIKNYIQQVNYLSSVITESFYWLLCLNLSFISFFIAVYVSFSLDSWLCFLTQKCDSGKFSYMLFVLQVYLMFCEINSFLTWITGIELSVSTSSFLSIWSNSLVNSWLHHFLTILIGAIATGISAVLADGLGKKMKSAGYHNDCCHCIVVVAWFLLLKEFSLVTPWVAGATDM